MKKANRSPEKQPLISQKIVLGATTVERTSVYSVALSLTTKEKLVSRLSLRGADFVERNLSSQVLVSSQLLNPYVERKIALI